MRLGSAQNFQLFAGRSPIVVSVTSLAGLARNFRFHIEAKPGSKTPACLCAVQALTEIPGHCSAELITVSGGPAGNDERKTRGRPPADARPRAVFRSAAGDAR